MSKVHIILVSLFQLMLFIGLFFAGIWGWIPFGAHWLVVYIWVFSLIILFPGGSSSSTEERDRAASGESPHRGSRRDEGRGEGDWNPAQIDDAGGSPPGATFGAGDSSAGGD
jgi:hypothetical protein